MPAFGHLDRVEVSHDFHTDCVKVQMEVYVQRAHAAEWQEFMQRRPKMIGVFDADQAPVAPPISKHQNINLSGSNPAAGSW